MHQNTYNHNESEIDYRKHISNIAYRFKFDIIYEEEQILKTENGIISVVVTSDETPRNTLCWKAWMKLTDEYGWHGLFKDTW